MSITMFLGITLLANRLHVRIDEHIAASNPVLAQIGETVFDGGFLYLVLQVFTAGILVLAANTAFQDFPRLSSILARDRFMPTWWTAAPVRSPILTGWAGGPAADALLAERPSMIDRALDSMSRAFGVPRPRLDALLAGTWTHDWQSDPFSRGAYTYAAAGGSGAHDALAKPVQHTLFFAGEATSSDETGTVAGAIASGFREAKKII